MKNRAIKEEELLANVCSIVKSAGVFLDKEMTPTSEAYNPSTTVDVAISEFLTGELEAIMPVPVISEENTAGFHRPEKGLAWVIDPLDGTLNALTKTTPFCISVALVDMLSLQAVLSGVSLPFLNEVYAAVRGKGASLNGKKLTRETVAKAVVAYGLPGDTMKNIGLHLEHLKAVLENGYITRQSGSTVHDVIVTASGRYHGFYQFGLFLWDFIGADLIARECGCASYYRRSGSDTEGLKYDYIVAGSAGELEKLKGLLC